MNDTVSFGRRARWAVSDTMLITGRNLLHYVRVPQLIFFAIIQPIIFTLLFAFVFGGAIDTPGSSYIDYLLPGIIVQTVIFGSMGSGINMAEDMQKGVMDRFRSLPISRGAILAARTISDAARNALSVVVMVAVGYGIGYRFHGTAADAALAVGLALAVGFAFAWIAALIGLMVRDTQTAEIAGFTWVFPLVFASSIFVPVATMEPAWVRWFATVNPITLSVDAVRAYAFGVDPGAALGQSLLWVVGMIALFGPLAAWRFRRLA